MITFPIGMSGQTLALRAEVIAHLMAHRQLRLWQNEAGGQLFAKRLGSLIIVEEATGPRPSDQRSRRSYIPDKRAEQLEIDLMHKRGLHYVGDWHTHPETIPLPSKQDLESIGECVRRSTHKLHGFVLVIVGRAAPPHSLHVSINDGVQSLRLVSAVEPAVSNSLDGTLSPQPLDRQYLTNAEAPAETRDGQPE